MCCNVHYIDMLYENGLNISYERIIEIYAQFKVVVSQFVIKLSAHQS